MINQNDKRGLGIGDIWPIMLTIAGVAILIALILLIDTSIQPYVALQSGGVTLNESGASVNSTGYTLANSSLCGFVASIIAVTNISTLSVPTNIPSANYTYNAATGVLTNRTATQYNTVNVSYSFTGGGQSCNALSTVNTQVFNFVPWIGIILLIFAAAIVLGILINSLGGGGKKI